MGTLGTEIIDASVEAEADNVTHISFNGATKQTPPTGGIALALGGGAARGWAHIGVLRAFDEAGVPISMIAGTSIGALVGGCYLAGKMDELEDFARSLTKTGILKFMDFALRGSGLIAGDRLAKRMAPHLVDIKIEELDRPFIAIATDIQNGHEIWLHDGPIIDAIRASYALPGVFQPVVHNGRLMVDGALVNPVPVSACRTYESDMVIAVNLNAETFGRGTVIRSSHYDDTDATNGTEIANVEQASPTSWLPFMGQSRAAKSASTAIKIGLTGVMMESFDIIQDRISRSRLAGDPPDFTIRPRLKNIGMADFHMADEAISQGLEVGRERIAELVAQGHIEIA
ncbi:MAG: patatin-like phospholipase family protein [Rhizobiaceae bacterium]|nr:patatin-like phospholipase family protein [Rhizobiaceae bacterium]